ncbi:MAG: hypothetical protein J5379_00740 [Clostridiales bacterium]|nr:hypothetical protein [Clostridiales bacterium]
MKKKSIMAVLLAMSMIASAACSSKEEKKSKKDKKSDKKSAATLDEEDEDEETEKKQKATVSEEEVSTTESEEAASTTEATESEKTASATEATTTEATEPEKETEKETEAEETMPANPANLQFFRDESVRPHISGPATYAVGDYIDLERPDYDVERIIGIRDGEVMTNYDVSNRCKILYDNQTYYEVAPAGGYLFFNGSFDFHGTQFQYELKLYPHISDPVFFQRKTGIFDKVTEDGLWIHDLFEMTIHDCVDENLNVFLVQYLDEAGLTPEDLIENPKQIAKVMTKVSDAMYFKTADLACVVCSYDITITGCDGSDDLT